MAAQDYYDTNVPDESIDVSASNRKFQTSIIIKQDAKKSGVLSFLTESQEQSSSIPTRPASQTVRPSRREGY